MNTSHNKLVRDKIPRILKRKKIKFHISFAKDKTELRMLLTRKLSEETKEFKRKPSKEELADLLETVFALADTIDCSRTELERERKRKKKQRGGFTKGVFLHWTEEK